MSGITLEFVRSSVRVYLLDDLPEKLGNFVTSEVNYLALFVLYSAMGMLSG
jgi:hypothetical protein